VVSCRPAGEKKRVKETVSVDSLSSDTGSLTMKIMADSGNPDNYYQRAKLYLDQKEINKALADIGKAIDLNDKDARYYVTLADLYLAMGKIPNCLEALKKAEEIDPKNNDALLKLAEVYLILKDYQSAFHYTKKALDHESINPVAYFIRGYAYMEQGDTTLAVKSFMAAADQDQNYYNAYIELGLLYSAKKNPLAMEYLQTAVKIEPNRAEGYYLLGMAYQEQEIISKAIETYEKLLVIDPDFVEAYYNLGYINLVYLQELELAIHYFGKVISLDPGKTDAYFNRGYSYELAGDPVNARKDYRKALEISPNYERAVNGLNRLDEEAQQR
jgi:tetratricopeptide (TPR) repeat protein